MGFLVGAALGDAVRRVVAEGPCDMAVAYWGTGADEVLGLPQNLSGYRIVCDAFSGSCAPATIETLLERGAAVFDVPKLHAKVYRSEAGMIVASANASTRGFDDRAPGLEAGVFDDDPARLEAAKAWFEKILPPAGELDLDDIPRLKLVWNPYGAGPRFSRPIAAALAGAAPDLGALDLRVYVYQEADVDHREEALYKASSHYDSATYPEPPEYPFFWGEWPGASPVGESFLCFGVAGDKVWCERVWTVLDPLRQDGLVVWPAREELRFELGGSDAIRALEGKVRRALALSLIVADTPPMPAYAFASILALAGKPWAEDAHARMASPEVREAYAAALAWSAGRKLAFDPKGGGKGAKISLKLLDGDGEQPFSFIVNDGHLLFYLRKPGLRKWPALAGALGAGLDAQRTESGDEIKIALRTDADVRRLAAWLDDVLPAALGQV